MFNATDEANKPELISSDIESLSTSNEVNAGEDSFVFVSASSIPQLSTTTMNACPDSNSEERPKLTQNSQQSIDSNASASSNRHIGSAISSTIASAFPSIRSIRSLSISSSTNSFNSKFTTTQAQSSKVFDDTKTNKERSNLLNLLKLVVKDLISTFTETTHQSQEMTDDSSIHLINYFVIIEKILKHGLRQNFLTTKSSGVWNALENLQKYLKESILISESVRSLNYTKTTDGKIRAWIRLAMMHKKLAEFIFELTERKDDLKLPSVYHESSLVMSQEMSFVSGLMVGVNLIDYNFDKNLNFDAMEDIIDLSPYLRAANCFDEPDEMVSISDEIESISFKKVLDKKNYLEELNKRLESDLRNLKDKLRNLEDQNGRLEMEAKLSEAKIQKLMKPDDIIRESPGISISSAAITNAFKTIINSKNLSSDMQKTNKDLSEDRSLVEPPSTDIRLTQEFEISPPEKESHDKQSNKQLKDTTACLDLKLSESSQTASDIRKDDVSPNRTSIINDELSKKFVDHDRELATLRERASILETSYREALDKIKGLERDLDIQTSINNDNSTTIEIFEKDIRDKQQQVESLRSSLSDAKQMNGELTKRLEEANSKLQERVKTVQLLQNNMDKWKIEHKTVVMRLADKEKALKSVNYQLEAANCAKMELEQENEKLKALLMKARECDENSSTTLETQAMRINELGTKLVSAERQLCEVEHYRGQSEKLSKKCKELEQSLEEVGIQLQESRLDAEELRENSAVFLDSQWLDSRSVKACALCQQAFSVTRRKHHCRLCGNVFCQPCSDNKMELASSAKPVRVCDTCHSLLLAKFVKGT